MMPPRLILLCGVLLLAGCASSGTTPSLFKLDNGDAARSDTPITATAPVILIEPVTVAPFLDESGIVYQTAPHRVVVANNNRWASPLASQLTDTLRTDLQNTLKGVNVQRAGRGQQPGAYRLRVRVDEFLGHYDGTAHIAGQWQLSNASGDTLAGRPFQIRRPLDEDGYPALVASLSQGWSAQAEAMAPPLRQALSPSQPLVQPLDR